MTVTLTKYPAPLLNKIGIYVCQAVIYIQQQQPELLLDKYRSISWRDNSNQQRLKTKLIEVIGNPGDWESLVNRVEGFIHTLLVSNSTNTPVLIKLQEKIRHLNPDTVEESNSSNEKQDKNSSALNQQEALATPDKQDIAQNQPDNNSTKSSQEEDLSQANEQNVPENNQDVNSANTQIDEQEANHQHSAIAALIIDAENTQITTETEQFLTNFSTSPIQIKIAFANWQNMGSKDSDFHHREYDLIHVPCGKDNADRKIIAFGSTIDKYFPKVKEVLLCASDNVMNSLCSCLQHKGLTVYQVSQHASNLTILDGKTNDTHNHIILPSIEKLLCQIKEIIEEQITDSSNQWIKLSKICKLFKEKYSFGINKVVSHHLPGNNVKNIFVNQPEFVLHQIPEHPELYVTLFKMPTVQDTDDNSSLGISEQ
ncbi:MAG: NYN domain-containing protein [Rivularia sp. (in: Bacteria)]|nr:NYN domain-containing protein [Rivularia sp. MS3]